MHITTNILNVSNVIGDSFAERGGLTELIKYLDERIVEDKINWKILERLIQVLFVFCLKDKNVRALKTDNILKRLVDTLVKAVDVHRLEVVMQVIKILTFFSDD